jgi:hypothetical protein
MRRARAERCCGAAVLLGSGRALNTTVLFHSCVYTACMLGGVAGNCSSGAADLHARAAAACTVGLRFLYRTRTATLPLTLAPLVPVPVPGQLTAQQFTLETSLPVSAGTKAQLDTALRFARDQVSSVLADPSAEPRQVSVNVDAVPLTATHYWLATVSASGGWG